MNFIQLQKFDLTYPGQLISGPDRDWAFQTAHVLSLIEYEFIRAVTSYAMFEPTTLENIDNYRELTQSKYEKCLNGIYAQTFAFSLNAIRMLLKKLKATLNPSDVTLQWISEYEAQFGVLEHIRNSAMHIEDRGRGLDKHENRLPSGLIVLGAFNGRKFQYSGEDGRIYGIEISENTLLSAHRILQAIIGSYYWLKTG